MSSVPGIPWLVGVLLAPDAADIGDRMEAQDVAAPGVGVVVLILVVSAAVLGWAFVSDRRRNR